MTTLGAVVTSPGLVVTSLGLVVTPLGPIMSCRDLFGTCCDTIRILLGHHWGHDRVGGVTTRSRQGPMGLDGVPVRS